VSQGLLTTAEAADYLRKSSYWLHANRKRLGIPSMKVGGEYRYRKTELDDWLEDQRTVDTERLPSRSGKVTNNRKIVLV